MSVALKSKASLLIIVIWCLGYAGVATAGTSASEPDVHRGGAYQDRPAAMVGVYLSIKEPKRSFVLAENRKVGIAHLKILNQIAAVQNIEPVLPVITDILQEAMMAVRIGMHDGRSLSNTADMQGAKIVLAGRLLRAASGADEWRVTWSISSLAGSLRWNLDHVSYAEALSDGLERVKRVLAGQLAVDPYPLRKLLPMVSQDSELMELEEKRSREAELNDKKTPANPKH